MAENVENNGVSPNDRARKKGRSGTETLYLIDYSTSLYFYIIPHGRTPCSDSFLKKIVE